MLVWDILQARCTGASNQHSAYSELGVAPWPPLLANANLFRNPNKVFESTYLCTATTKSLQKTTDDYDDDAIVA